MESPQGHIWYGGMQSLRKSSIVMMLRLSPMLMQVRCRDLFYETFDAMRRQEAAGEDGRHGFKEGDPEANVG